MAGDRFAVDFFAGAVFEAVLFAARDDVLAAVFVAVLVAVLFAAGADFDAVLFAAVVLAVVLDGVDFAAADFAGLDFAAVDFEAVAVDFEAVDFAADFVADFAAVFDAAPLEAAVFDVRFAGAPSEAALAVDLVAVALLLAVRLPAAALFAGALAIFLAPLAMARNSEPGLKAGTLVFFTFTEAPVAGLRAVRALRSRRSKAPKPVSTTRSPFEIDEYTVSITASRAACALRLSPSSRWANWPMNSALFTCPPAGRRYDPIGRSRTR